MCGGGGGTHSGPGRDCVCVLAGRLAAAVTRDEGEEGEDEEEEGEEQMTASGLT